jgi:hypothetical protein
MRPLTAKQIAEYSRQFAEYISRLNEQWPDSTVTKAERLENFANTHIRNCTESRKIQFSKAIEVEIL